LVQIVGRSTGMMSASYREPQVGVSGYLSRAPLVLIPLGTVVGSVASRPAPFAPPPPAAPLDNCRSIEDKGLLALRRIRPWID
jgi:hypothetical protein